MLTRFLEQRPGFGILASFTGIGTSVTSFFHDLGFLFSLGGAVFGCMAGYYTWRVQRHKWQREQLQDPQAIQRKQLKDNYRRDRDALQNYYENL